MAKGYKVGDVVRLRTGGPDMVVNSRTPGGQLSCVWFAGKKSEHAYFSPDVLVPGDAEPPKDQPK